MDFKKVFLKASLFVGCLMSFGAHAQEAPLVTLFPGAGVFLESQQFDIAVNVSPLVPLPYTLTYPYYAPFGPSASPIKINAFVNGRDVSNWFRECMQEHRTTGTEGRVLLCKHQDYSPFTVGDNYLKIEINNGSQSYLADAMYTFVASDRKLPPLPYRFVIQGSSLSTASGVKAALNDRFNISATGYVNTWPANTSFPISTPRGTQTCASNSTCLLPGAPVGGLLVKIGTYGRWVFVGAGTVFVADRPGELIFAVNDKSEFAGASDNTGSYEINIAKY